MHVKVCYGCPLRLAYVPGRITQKRCDLLQSKLDGVRGLGLKAITFDCPTKAALFQPGQEVTFKGYVGDEMEDFTGYVFGWKDSKVRIVSQESNNPFVKIFPSKLRATGHTRRVCIHCGMPEDMNIQIKMENEAEPRPWICRSNPDFYDEGGPEQLPCEYPGAGEGK